MLIVDDKGKARTAKKDLADARVTAKIMGETKGPKIEVVKFRNKTRYRRRTGHRQHYTMLQIADIKLTAGRGKKAPAAPDEPSTREVGSDGA